MLLKLLDDGAPMAVLNVDSTEELEAALTRVQAEQGTRFLEDAQPQIHLWHNEAWWNLSDDIAQFHVWSVETGRASLNETRAWADDPFSRSDLLFEAARQMKKLLEAADGISKESEERLDTKIFMK